MLACHDEYCSASVPEVVKPDGGQFRPPTNRLEVKTREVRHPHGGADTLAELGSHVGLQEALPFGNGGRGAELHFLSRSSLGTLTYLQRPSASILGTRDSPQRAVLV